MKLKTTKQILSGTTLNGNEIIDVILTSKHHPSIIKNFELLNSVLIEFKDFYVTIKSRRKEISLLRGFEYESIENIEMLSTLEFPVNANIIITGYDTINYNKFLILHDMWERVSLDPNLIIGCNGKDIMVNNKSWVETIISNKHKIYTLLNVVNVLLIKTMDYYIPMRSRCNLEDIPTLDFITVSNAIDMTSEVLSKCNNVIVTSYQHMPASEAIKYIFGTDDVEPKWVVSPADKSELKLVASNLVSNWEIDKLEGIDMRIFERAYAISYQLKDQTLNVKHRCKLEDLDFTKFKEVNSILDIDINTISSDDCYMITKYSHLTPSGIFEELTK